jgi:hypothetical protein
MIVNGADYAFTYFPYEIRFLSNKCTHSRIYLNKLSNVIWDDLLVFLWNLYFFSIFFTKSIFITPSKKQTQSIWFHFKNMFLVIPFKSYSNPYFHLKNLVLFILFRLPFRRKLDHLKDSCKYSIVWCFEIMVCCFQQIIHVKLKSRFSCLQKEKINIR